MEAGTGTGKGSNVRRLRTKATGRISGGQEAPIALTKLKDAIGRAKEIATRKAEAETDWSDFIKKTAEECGISVKSAGRYFKAHVGDKFDEAKRDVRQLALIFEVDDPKLI